MKRIVISLSLLFTIITLTSCSYNNGNISTDITISETSAEELTFVPQGEELVYVTPAYETISGNVANSLNLYLQSLDKPYYIRFEAIETSEDFGGEYLESLKKMIDSGKAVDLLQTGLPWDINGYEDLAQNGYLYDLSEYLSSTEGKAFYNSIPKYFWENAKVNSKIYGANGYTYGRCSCPSYMINKSLMEKYGLKKEDFNRPISQLADIFAKVRQGEGEDFYPFTAEISPDYSISSSYGVCSGINIDRSTGTARILTDDKDYMSFIEDIYEMKELGFYSYDSGRKLDKFLLSFSFRTPFPDYLIYDGTYTFEGKTATADDVMIIPLEEYGSYQGANYSNTCVCAKSKHTDYAIDFLNTVFTDRRVTDYLLFGAESIDYELEDGKVSYKSFHPEESDEVKFTAQIPKMLIYGNSFICTPRYYESDDMNKVYMDMHNSLKEDPYNKFYFNDQGCEESLKNIEIALELISNGLTDGKTFEEMKAELEKKLKEAGADKVLQEVNKQLQEYLAS